MGGICTVYAVYSPLMDPARIEDERGTVPVRNPATLHVGVDTMRALQNGLEERARVACWDRQPHQKQEHPAATNVSDFCRETSMHPSLTRLCTISFPT